jgi:hypothetical protein
MHVSTWHKAQGDTVEIAFPLAAHTYDRVYRSKPFTFTPDDMTPWPCEVISGGTGYDPVVRLPMGDLDDVMPDYGLFGCDHGVGRITRGCPRRCPFCVVTKMDGSRVHQVAEVTDFLHPVSDRLSLLDDNLTAMPDLFVQTCELLSSLRVRVKFEALDARFIDRPAAQALMSVRRWGNLHFAWDSTSQERAVFAGLSALKAAYPSMHDVLVYVLIGYDTPTEDWLYRCEKLRAFGALPFVMPYDKADPLQADFARYWNHKAIARSVTWEEYRRSVRRPGRELTGQLES